MPGTRRRGGVKKVGKTKPGWKQAERDYESALANERLLEHARDSTHDRFMGLAMKGVSQKTIEPARKAKNKFWQEHTKAVNATEYRRRKLNSLLGL